MLCSMIFTGVDKRRTADRRKQLFLCKCENFENRLFANSFHHHIQQTLYKSTGNHVNLSFPKPSTIP